MSIQTNGPYAKPLRQENRIFATFETDGKHAIIPALFHLQEVLYLAEPHWVPDTSKGSMNFKPIYYHYDMFDGEELRPTHRRRFNGIVKRHYKKVSPLFLKAVHGREFVEITDIKIERLQEITEKGCKLEGMTLKDHETYKDCFTYTWVWLHGIQSWNVNPWVWVYKYKYLKDQSGRKL
jgi:hypothetical protein